MLLETAAVIGGLGLLGAAIDAASGTKSTTTKHYRSRSGDNYAIRYEEKNGKYKMYADQHPEPARRGPASDSHLYKSGEICVTKGQEPRSMDRAKGVAQVWMEGYSEYCRSGEFPTGKRRVDV